LSLVKNADLLDMARLGRASIPIDLMSYAPSDQQPSVFLLKENERQAMLTVFNWTEASRTRAINLAQLGLKEPGKYKMVDALGDEGCCDISAGAINLSQKPHSVRMIKFIDNSVPAAMLTPTLESTQ
jgi:alpha-galactosidase